MINTFQSEVLPQNCSLIGYSWLLEHFCISLPLRVLSCISSKRLKVQTIKKGSWIVYDAQLMFEEDSFSHLEFALKHETIDLLLLKSIFSLWDKKDFQIRINENRKKTLRKKAWFLYEFLLGSTLELEDLPSGKYDNLLDTKKFIVRNDAIKSKRHKINNNLLGTSKFCPIILQTGVLKSYMSKNLKTNVSEVIEKAPSSIIKRAASFLLLADSKASFEIEGERPAKDRVESWGKIISQAGKHVLSIDEIQRLHTILLQDSRFTQIGLRKEGVFLGERDRDNNPLPEFIGAKEEDLVELMQDWLDLNDFLSEDTLDPILHAVIIAFSFVYIHPLEDGNGRIHRYILHHVLAQRGFYPKGMIFPLSNVILEEIEKYKDILVSHTFPLMQAIHWEATNQGNVQVLNKTRDLYTYFNCTKSCEFIYHCVEKTIEETLPQELEYLESFDKSYAQINEVIEMPDTKIKTLITFILQNNNKLSKNKREKFFARLEDQELQEIQNIIEENFCRDY
ncbi:MAG: cell filamentation protein Fic [Arcobacter sp.]|nr:MAG: cell filamentation protein Fic [Arcobacter sp.]